MRAYTSWYMLLAVAVLPPAAACCAHCSALYMHGAFCLFSSVSSAFRLRQEARSSHQRQCLQRGREIDTGSRALGYSTT